MIDKLTRQREFLRQFLGEGLYSKDLRGVVPPIKSIDPQILGQGMAPMRSFTGNEGVNTLLTGKGQL